MSPFQVLATQQTLSLVAFALLARWHVAPRLAVLPRAEALTPLLWVHVFRYAPLTLYAPGQVDPLIPADAAAAVAYGDLAAAPVAMVALAALKLRARGAMALVWAFSVVSVADLVYATWKAVGAEMYRFPMGWNWYILNFYVPMLVVSQAMILHRLVRDPRQKAHDAPPGNS
jgi:hypothetical protein